MIVGIGIDVIEPSRINAKLKKPLFKHKIFSAIEIEYCEKQKNKAQHYAARFAMKEAFLKATGYGLLAGYELSQIELQHTSGGQPELILTGDFLKLKKKNKWLKIHVSISHIESCACAIVILEK